MYMHFKGKKKILVLNMLNKNKNNVMIKYTSNIGSHKFF